MAKQAKDPWVDQALFQMQRMMDPVNQVADEINEIEGYKKLARQEMVHSGDAQKEERIRRALMGGASTHSGVNPESSFIPTESFNRKFGGMERAAEVALKSTPVEGRTKLRIDMPQQPAPRTRSAGMSSALGGYRDKINQAIDIESNSKKAQFEAERRAAEKRSSVLSEIINRKRQAESEYRKMDDENRKNLGEAYERYELLANEAAREVDPNAWQENASFAQKLARSIAIGMSTYLASQGKSHAASQFNKLANTAVERHLRAQEINARTAGQRADRQRTLVEFMREGYQDEGRAMDAAKLRMMDIVKDELDKISEETRYPVLSAKLSELSAETLRKKADLQMQLSGMKARAMGAGRARPKKVKNLSDGMRTRMSAALETVEKVKEMRRRIAKSGTGIVGKLKSYIPGTDEQAIQGELESLALTAAKAVDPNPSDKAQQAMLNKVGSITAGKKALNKRLKFLEATALRQLRSIREQHPSDRYDTRPIADAYKRALEIRSR